MSDPLFKSSLDGLLRSAMANQALTQTKVKRMPDSKGLSREALVRESFKATYANPDNWAAGSHIAVIHRDDKGNHQLLGAFQEFFHVRKSAHLNRAIRTGARKLVRAEGPVLIAHEEIVTGDQWLHGPAPEQHIPDNPEEIFDHQLTFNLSLADLQADAPEAKIEVRTERGWIRWVKLVNTTQFLCPTSRVAFFLPKNIDVLEAMSHENKIVLKNKIKGVA